MNSGWGVMVLLSASVMPTGFRRRDWGRRKVRGVFEGGEDLTQHCLHAWWGKRGKGGRGLRRKGLEGRDEMEMGRAVVIVRKMNHDMRQSCVPKGTCVLCRTMVDGLIQNTASQFEYLKSPPMGRPKLKSNSVRVQGLYTCTM